MYLFNKLFITSYVAILICFFAFLLKRKLIIICDNYGRLGNRLHLFAQMIIFSKTNNYIIWMPGFNEYNEYFQNIKNKPLYGAMQYPIPRIFSSEQILNALNRIYIIVSKIPKNFALTTLSFYKFDDGSPWETIQKFDSKCTLFKGFVFQEYTLDNLIARNDITKMFTPKNTFNKEIIDPISKLKIKNDYICGVLIRQTDYRTWNNGKYFFTTEEYGKIINNLNIHLQDLKVGYFIATDEEQPIDFLQNLDRIIRVGHPIQNLYTLSHCDFLIGPPSSFIGWSSLYGRKHLFTIYDKDNTNYMKKIKRLL